MPASIPALASRVAELLRQQMCDLPSPAVEEVRRLVHEMESRQGELEQQIEELRKTQRHLEAYRDRYVDLYDFAPLGYVTLDEDGYVQEINLAGAKLLGAEREALIGYAFADYVASEDQEAFLNHVRQCAGEQREVTSELRLVSETGHSITAQFHSIPIEGPTEETLCKTAITDITQRKQAEEALRDSESELRLIMDSVPTLISLVGLDGRYRRVNETYERWFSLAGVDVRGRHIREVLGEAAWQAIQPHVERALAGEMVTYEEELPLRGDSRWLHATYTPERDESGRVCGFVVHAADIGEHRRMEEALREGQQRFQNVADFSYAWEYWRAADGQFLYCSPACERITGYSRDEFIQAPPLFDRIIHPEDLARWEAHLREVEGYPGECELEFRIVRRDSQERWIGHVCQPVMDAQGRPQGRRASNRDITEHKEAEVRLLWEKSCTDTIINSLPGIFYLFDDQGRFLRWNKHFEQVSGYSGAEISTLHPLDFFRGDEKMLIAERIQEVFAKGASTAEAEFVSKNGVATPYFFTGNRMLFDALPCVVGMGVDISQRKQAEERSRLIVESAPYAMVMADTEGRIMLANAQTESLFGYRREELIGQSVELLVPEQFRGEHSQYRRGYTADPQMRPMGIGRDLYARRKDGIQVPVEIGLSPVRTGEGTLMLASIADITERKRAEEALQQAKADAEKANEAKSRFLAYVSHDLRTPMNSILGMVDLALERAIEPTVMDFLQTAKGSADLLLALLNDLLDNARIESGKLALEAAPFSLRRVLDQTTRVLAVRANQKGVSFSSCIPPEVPDWLVGDQVRLRQILLNLGGNGIKFTEEGEVAVNVRAESHSDDEVCLEFAVRDTGIGIPQSDSKRIFEPFAQADPSTTRRFGGTGLGLTISARLVGMMGGRIWVESEPEHGSVFHFTVRLPLAKEPLVEPESSPEVAVPATSLLRVLLVDDNPANQKLAAYLLRDRGHTVEIAAGGRQALRMAQQTHYDAILMDISMPDMDGLEATTAIRGRESADVRVPIIAVTGDAMEGDRQRCLEAGMDGYLSKPINGREMISLVENLAAGKTVPAAVGAATTAPGPLQMPAADANIFDREEAIKHCFGREDGFPTMVGNLFKDVERLLPEMRSALQRGDVQAVGELGHRLKGTLVYLGAKQATEAALRVEQFARSSGQLNEAEGAVGALERECEFLKTVLAKHYVETGLT